MKTMNKGLAGIVVLALAAAACTPSPEKVCDHVRELEQRSGRHDAAEMARNRTGCVETFTAVRTRNAGAYKTAARCVMNATDETAADLCVMPLMGILDH